MANPGATRLLAAQMHPHCLSDGTSFGVSDRSDWFVREQFCFHDVFFWPGDNVAMVSTASVVSLVGCKRGVLHGVFARNQSRHNAFFAFSAAVPRF